MLERGDGAGAVEAAGQRVGGRAVFECVAELGRLGDVGNAHHAAGDLSVASPTAARIVHSRCRTVPSASDVIDDEPRRDAVAQQRTERGGQVGSSSSPRTASGEQVVGIERGEQLGQPSVGVLDPAARVELGDADGQRLGEERDELALGDQRLGRGDLEEMSYRSSCTPPLPSVSMSLVIVVSVHSDDPSARARRQRHRRATPRCSLAASQLTIAIS